MIRNSGAQIVGAQMVTASDGSAFTGAVTCYVTGDGGTQAVGSVGSGACTHEGNGYHTYAPAKAETDYTHVAFTFVGTGAVPATVQMYPDPSVLRRATAQGGTATTITLDASASATNDIFNGAAIAIVKGTGAGQTPRTVTDYNGTSKIATVDVDWAITPDSASVFEIYSVPPAPASFDADLISINGSAEAAVALSTSGEGIIPGTVASGSTTTAVVTALTEATNDHYKDRAVVFTTGALKGQARTITDYNGSTKTLTVAALTEIPSNGDKFVIV